MLMRKATCGVGMVEVLVAVVVIGIGLLGIASLYVVTLQAKTTSLSRFQAITLANDIADRIRANRSAETVYDTSITTAPVSKSCAAVSTTASTCSNTDMAINDLYLWQAEIAKTLPGNPTGTIAVTAKVPTGTLTYIPAIYTIKINWSEPTSAGLSYTLVVQI